MKKENVRTVGKHVLLPDLSYEVLGAAIDVHRELGPGLLERVYHVAMEKELKSRGLSFQSFVKIPVMYKGERLGEFAYEADIVVEGKIVLELKSVERLLHVHTAQALTYMRLLDCKVGYVLNFNVANLARDGRKRLVL